MRIWKVPLVLVLIVAGATVLLWQLAKQPLRNASDKALSRPLMADPEAGVNGLSARGIIMAEDDTQLTAEQQAMLDDPRVIEFAKRLDFQDEVRGFFSDAAALPPDETRRKATAIGNRLNEYENTRQVSAPEALVLRLAMVQLLEPDEASAKTAAAALIEEYRSASEARLADWKSRPKPEFESYKDREQAIVAEVMAMERFPDGLTRDQYLRQRLQEARIETMGQGEQK